VQGQVWGYNKIEVSILLEKLTVRF